MTHWIGTSWKMNKTLAEAKAFAAGLLRATVDPRIQLVELQGAGDPLRALEETNCLADAEPARARALGLVRPALDGSADAPPALPATASAPFVPPPAPRKSA